MARITGIRSALPPNRPDPKENIGSEHDDSYGLQGSFADHRICRVPLEELQMFTGDLERHPMSNEA
jgi:hypothetical protein